jgi:uncharacterized membrane protein
MIKKILKNLTGCDVKEKAGGYLNMSGLAVILGHILYFRVFYGKE